MITFGTKIRFARKKLNMSQDDLANKLEVSRVAISNYETDKNTPTYENIKKLSKILQTDLGSLKKDVNTKYVPLIGKASCGKPNDYELDDYEQITVPSDMYRSGMYAVQADGDSMSPKINDGDILYCCPDLQVDSGKIVHYSLNGESGVKRYKINESGTIISLIPINPKYDIIAIHSEDNVDLQMARVVGKIDKDF